MEILACQDELIQRYKYLYENKEIILALCIKYECATEYYKKRLKNDKKNLKEMKKLKKNHQADLEFCNSIIVSILESINHDRKMMHVAEPYLCAKVENKIVDDFKEFILGDKKIEETDLYRRTERTKNDSAIKEALDFLVSEVQKRREQDSILKDIPAFTVWKMLTYVRNKYADNAEILKALDKYYNLDRYMMTQCDWESGYNMSTDDLLLEHELEKFPKNYIVSSGFPGDAIIAMSEGNGIELEDDYCSFDEEECLNGTSYSNFSVQLSQMDMLPLEKKMEVYNELVNPYIKTIF